MDTVVRLKSLSPKRKRKKEPVVEAAPPTPLLVGDVVYLGDGTDGYLASDALGARVSFKRGEGGGVPTYKLGCLWQLFPDGDYRSRERLQRLGRTSSQAYCRELTAELQTHARREKLTADTLTKAVERGAMRDGATYGEAVHLRHVVTGR